MRKIVIFLILIIVLWPVSGLCENTYVPTAENLQARKEFADNGFGIFLHWGIYSMMGRGEWYLNYGPKHAEYSKAARGFYPAHFCHQMQ